MREKVQSNQIIEGSRRLQWAFRACEAGLPWHVVEELVGRGLARTIG